jgi:pectate lyase
MNTSKNIAAETIARASLSAAPRRQNGMARFFLPALGLLTALVSTGCVVDTEHGDSDPRLAQEETQEETTESELALTDSLADRVQIITGATDEREGWGGGATGGASGTIYHVTNRKDSGAGSLRDALESPSPLWIIFDVSGTIELESTVDVKSNKTVDGRGKQIEIKTKNDHTTAFAIHGQQNIILLNLEFDNGWLNYTTDSEGADAINIVSSHDIWIHHCEFLQWSDGAIDIKPLMDGAGIVYNVSVTWSRFRKVFQGMLWEGDQLSLGHSVCDDVFTRCPKIVGGKAHSYNNYIASWGSQAIQHAESGGQLYSQRNIFDPGGQKKVNQRNGDASNKIELDNNEAPSNVVFDGGSNNVDATFKAQSQSNANVDVCSTSSCWTALKDRLLNGDAAHAAAGNSL